ncbi:hypothetical protein A3L11_03985 [Thermococcus siculi]|uniref:DUF11 domain-containing protein n=1 Tax=Thermococcus siculi TaxID=72803 RepID=A0A2Z2MP46_9EURY|nr:hypothetical protein [Thermococcus siculi]ASJ08437.1 hypothetical protein A3L11_03985 [Thermococcus siculi]
MRSIAAVLITLALASLIIVSSSGTFVSFEAAREVRIQVVPHEEEYIGFLCRDGYAAVVEVTANSETDFDALTVRNYLTGNRDVTILLYPDYSGLPGNAEMFVETEDGAPRIIASEDEYTFFGNVTVGDVAPGEYIVPMDMYAEWNDGDASITPCPIKLVVKDGPNIEKTLLSGNTTDIPMKTYQEWVFQIKVTNPTDEDITVTVKDTIPAEFNVSLARTAASAGTYEFRAANSGHNHHGGHAHPATKLEWNVTIPAGGSEHMNVTIFTRVNHGCQQEFTSCGEYNLNDGATLVEYGITSNPLTVSVACDGCGNCCDCDHHEGKCACGG